MRDSRLCNEPQEVNDSGSWPVSLLPDRSRISSVGQSRESSGGISPEKKLFASEMSQVLEISPVSSPGDFPAETVPREA